MNTSYDRKRHLNLYRQHLRQELDALGYAGQRPAADPAMRGAARPVAPIAGIAALALTLAGAIAAGLL